MHPDIEIHTFAEEKVLRSRLPASEELNVSLLADLLQAREDLTYSHLINGRWENAYLPIERISRVREVIGYAQDIVFRVFEKRLLALYKSLEADTNPPFWFNLAEPGEITGVHDHSKAAEISGVYYIATPPSSGDLFFRTEGAEDFFLQPIEGTLVLFPSNLRHGVAENLSEYNRISLAFNLFKIPMEIF